MGSLLLEVSDKLLESIAKSRAVADLLRTTDNRNLSNETLPDIGWLLHDELKQMEEQINRLHTGSGN
jgi:hypothetical protein